MHICIFTSHYGGGYGTGYAIKKEVEELIKLGHHIFVIHSEKSIDYYKSEGIEFKYFSQSSLPLLNIFITKKRLRNIINQILKYNKIDLFYVQSLIFGLVRKRDLQGIPMVYFARSTILGAEQNKPKEYWFDAINKMIMKPILISLERRCFNNCRCIIVKSTRMKNELIKLYSINSSQIKIVSGGISINDFPFMEKSEILKLKQKLKISNTDPIILFAGRITPTKGIAFLLYALYEFIKTTPQVKLIIVGSNMMNNYHRFIYRLVNSLKLKKFVLFVGYIPQKEMYQYFYISDVVVVPSTYEPFGMTIIQAAVLNKPIIATNCCGCLELIHDYPLLTTIPPFSSASIVDALRRSFLNRRPLNKFLYQMKLESWRDVAKNLVKIFISIQHKTK